MARITADNAIQWVINQIATQVQPEEDNDKRRFKQIDIPQTPRKDGGQSRTFYYYLDAQG